MRTCSKVFAEDFTCVGLFSSVSSVGCCTVKIFQCRFELRTNSSYRAGTTIGLQNHITSVNPKPGSNIM